ncbi:MAG: zf-HC2 domain-containing protein [Gammaproteobacteria bacterium]|nr:zf-HC2 domain-containing protein [Gammaproteobacteria bacterium]
MKCNDIKTEVDEYLDDQLSSKELALINEHIKTCDSCQQFYSEAKHVKQMLNNLPMEEPAPGFEQRLFAAVNRQYPQPAQHHFKAGFATAVAASLAIWFAVSVFVPGNTEQALDVVSIGLQESRDLKLVFTSVDDIQQASMQIELPDNIELLGYPGQKMLAWKTKLDKGQNVLTLPVQALGKVEGELVARVDYGDKQKTYRLLLKTANDGALNYLMMETDSV